MSLTQLREVMNNIVIDHPPARIIYIYILIHAYKNPRFIYNTQFMYNNRQRIFVFKILYSI